MNSTVFVKYRQYGSWAIVVPYFAVSLFANKSDGLSVFGDIAQFLLVSLLTFACWMRVKTGNSRSKVFWALMGTGAALWTGSQLCWSYFEIFRKTPAPNAQWGDVLLFMHVVPMTAALLFAPHKRRRISVLSSLSIAMLVAWWIYLYAFVVVPWMAVAHDAVRYRASFTLLYAVENFATILGLAFLVTITTGAWKKLYVQLTVFCVVYAVNSALLDKIIARGVYYTGSIYDLLFLIPVAWLCQVVLTHSEPLAISSAEPLHEEGKWVTPVSVAGLLSVPAIGLWTLRNTPAGTVRDFRMVVSFIAVIVICGLLLTKLKILRTELVNLIAEQKAAVSELRGTQTRLIFQANHDPMTGALNRGALYGALENAIDLAHADGSSVSVLMIDLDHFKNVNDMYGHCAGDLAIQRAIVAVRRHTRERDILGRYGGEEFVVALPECDEDTATVVAERIRKTIENDNVSLNGVVVRFTTSIGITTLRAGDTVDEILRRADLALYAAKKHGRNRVHTLAPAN